MSDDQPDSNQGGVFGKLPDSRPGSRSPRREGRGKSAAAKRPAAASKPRSAAPRRKPAAKPEQPRRPAPPPPPPAAAREAPAESGAGLDDLAWAGVAAIAEAATFGVRLANRAFGAIRGGDGDDTDPNR